MLWTLDSIFTAWHESASVEATNGKSSNGRSVVGRDVGEAQDGRGERGQRGRSGTFLFLQKQAVSVIKLKFFVTKRCAKIS